MAQRKVKSKYPESEDPKVSFGPVYAANPKFIRQLLVVEMGDTSWVHVSGFSWDCASELETLEWCNAVVEACMSINPNIIVKRDLR